MYYSIKDCKTGKFIHCFNERGCDKSDFRWPKFTKEEVDEFLKVMHKFYVYEVAVTDEDGKTEYHSNLKKTVKKNEVEDEFII